MSEEFFSTDLKRLTEILAVNLYNDPFVPIREVLQNANDACLIRRGFTAFESARITLTINSRERYVEIADNGCGMTAEELRTVLSRIASSNKIEKRKQLLSMGFDGANSIAGKFGLGMLSCFIIAKRVEILTRSMERQAEVLTWKSAGDGKYNWDISREKFEIGTRLRLFLKEESHINDLLNTSKLREIAKEHCRFLRVPIYFAGSDYPINNSIAPWDDLCPDDEVEEFVRSHFNCGSLYHFRFSHFADVRIGFGQFEGENAKELSLKAMVFIPDTTYGYEYLGKADVYASGIYVGRLQNVLPDWLTFGSVVLESASLDLTLGRDNVVQDRWLAAAKQVIAQKATQHIFTGLGDRSSRLRTRFKGIFRVHGQAIKQQAERNYVSGDRRFFESVKDVIPFPYRESLLSIPEFCESTPSQGEKDGKRVVYYFAKGFGERGSGLQEQVLFDNAEIPYVNAVNYYDRDFLQTYNRSSSKFILIPVQEGIQYVLKFEGIPPMRQQLVQDAFAQLGVHAKACVFAPHDLPAVISAVSQQRQHEPDYDVKTPEGRQQLLEALVRREISVRGEDSGYTLCLNIGNPLVEDVIKRIEKDGPQPAYRLALRLIYNNAVILFGEHSNREMARVISAGTVLMQSYLKTLTEMDVERVRYGRLLSDKESDLNAIEAKLKEVEEKMKAEEQMMQTRNENERMRVFLAHSYRDDDEPLAHGLRQLLETKGFTVVDGKADRLGSVGESIVEKIKSCRFFVALMTKRHQVEQSKFSTSSWFLEEKGVALGAGKVVVLLIEEGIPQEFFGELQGDLQRFHFNRATDFMSECLKVAELMTTMPK